MQKNVFIIVGVGVLGLVVYSLWPAASTSTYQDPTPSVETTTDGQPDISDEPDAASPAAMFAKDDPSQDGWTTEVFAESAKKQLGKLIHLLSHSESIKDAEVADFVTGSYQGTSLLPQETDTVYQDAVFKVERLKSSGPRATKNQSDSEVVNSPWPEQRGAANLVAALREWASVFQGGEELRYEIKIVGVEMSEATLETTQRVSVTAPLSTGGIEQHARWKVGWRRSEKDKSLQMQWLRVEDFEQTVMRHAGHTLFADCTQSLLQANPCFTSQVLKGYGRRVANIQDARYCVYLGTPGMAVGDVNGDGLEDIYLCLEAGQPNLFFLQQDDGTLKNVAREWEVDWLHDSRGVLLVDWDNDGDQDLAVATVGAVLLVSNEGERFEVRAVLPTSDDTMSLSAADYDADGNVDLYVCVYAPTQGVGVGEPTVPGGGAGTEVFYDSKLGGPNTLFQNKGNWEFHDVTSEVGLDAGNFRQSLATTWEDFDNDGDSDLYVANDFGPNNLFRNDSADPADESSSARVFVDVAAIANNEDRAFGMSAVWGDYNRDGLMDLYVGNMFSAAGNRVTFQADFKPDAGDDVRSVLQGFARGNSLLKNVGKGLFRESSAEARVAMGRWSWSSSFVDLNNDAWEDLVVANGYITGEDSRDL